MKYSKKLIVYLIVMILLDLITSYMGFSLGLVESQFMGFIPMMIANLILVYSIVVLWILAPKVFDIKFCQYFIMFAFIFRAIIVFHNLWLLNLVVG